MAYPNQAPVREMDHDRPPVRPGTSNYSTPEYKSGRGYHGGYDDPRLSHQRVPGERCMGGPNYKSKNRSRGR